MPKLKQNKNGSYSSRARIPNDVRPEFKRLHGQGFEAKFFAPSGTKAAQAQRLFHEWHAEFLGQVANIRAALAGEGSTLSNKQLSLLAADWYRWFLGRYEHEPHRRDWEGDREDVQFALNTANGSLDHYTEDELPQLVPKIAALILEKAEAETFLGQQGLVLVPATKQDFAEILFDFLGNARALMLQSRGLRRCLVKKGT